MKTVFLSLGSNLGDRILNLDFATKGINTRVGRITKLSSIYISEPWGFISKELFLNQIVVIETNKTPKKVLEEIITIENEMGRSRTSEFYESRIIDIDILFYDDLLIEEPELIIPHPLLHERLFILIPLNELSPDHLHPVLKKSVSEILKGCNDKSRVEPLKMPKSKIKLKDEIQLHRN